MQRRTLLSVREIAARWGLDRKTVYERVLRGELPCVRFGRTIRVPLAEVEAIERARR